MRSESMMCQMYKFNRNLFVIVDCQLLIVETKGLIGVIFSLLIDYKSGSDMLIVSPTYIIHIRVWWK